MMSCGMQRRDVRSRSDRDGVTDGVGRGTAAVGAQRISLSETERKEGGVRLRAATGFKSLKRARSRRDNHRGRKQEVETTTKKRCHCLNVKVGLLLERKLGHYV